jgi:hypothetical protein
MFRWIVPALVAAAVAGAAPAARSATFTLLPAGSAANQVSIKLTLNNLFSDTDASDASGTLEVDLDWNLVGDGIQLTGLEITSAALSFSNLDFVLGFGAVLISGRNLGGTMDTPQPPSLITANAFPASDHTLIINRGNFLVTGLFEDNFDLATSPFSGAGAGTGQIALVEAGRSPTEIHYSATITLPVAFRDRVLDAGAGDPATLDVDVAGTLVAVGQFSAPLGPPPAAADFNADGLVNGADFAIWQRGFGIAADAPPAQGDANADGQVNADDFAVWEQQFGAAGGAAAGSIPEPTAAAGAAIGCGLFVSLRGCGRRRIGRN